METIKEEVANRLLNTLDILNDKINFHEKPTEVYPLIECIEEVSTLIKSLYSKGEE